MTQQDAVVAAHEADDRNPHGYPLAPWRPVEDQWPGETIIDGYRWFENAQNPEVLAWVAEENAYTDAFFAREMPCRVQARIDYLRAKAGSVTYSGVTPIDGGRGGYIADAVKGGLRTIVRLDEDFANPEQLFCAQDAGGLCKVVSAAPCPTDPNILACCVLFDRAPRLSVLVRDVAAGETLVRLDGMFYYAWDAKGEHLYYSDAKEHPESGTNSNYVHRWNRADNEVELVYQVQENAVFCDVQPDALGGVFVMVCPDYGTQIVYHLNADEVAAAVQAPAGASAAARPVSGDVSAAFAYVGTVGDRHLLLTNWDAPMGRIISVDAAGPDLSDAREVIAQPGAGEVLCGALVMGETVVCAFQKNAASALGVYGLDGARLCEVPLPDDTGCLATGEQLASPCVDSACLCLEFESFRMPPSIIRYDAAARRATTLYVSGTSAPQGSGAVKADAIPQANADVVVERIDVPARDGETLCAYLVHRADVKPTGEVPALFFGYGGYNVVLAPDYTNAFVGLDVADWAHRGGLYVHCILRGGGERGPAWHEAGMLGNKPNVFHDFIDIIKRVQELGWTCPDKTAICGGSNGGLLVTATLTQEPELMRAVIASVPHTDMLRFAYDDRGPMYITEYGDPRDEALFPIMRGYSPYHNIRAGQAYPALYVQTGELDNNVPPYHGKKFAARMQCEAAPTNPVVLRVLARGSHDRGEGDAYYQTVSEMQCFLEHYLGMEE